jgi:alkylation response protein AidB-like acyl-CoA dehydrogenase
MLHSLENTKRNIDEFSDTLQEKGEKLQQRAQDGFKETKRSIGKQLRQKGEQLESGMVKLYNSDMAMKVTTDAVQLAGGIGYMRDFPIEKYMRDAKITQIYEGTNQIQRNEIGMTITKELATSK